MEERGGMRLLRRPAVLITGMTAALLAVQAIYMKETLLHVAGWGQAWALSALFALVFGAAMTAFSRLERPGAGTLAAVGGFLAAMMLARVAMLDYETADYVSFLSGWLDVFREGDFSTLAENVGDYNLLYQYYLLLVAKMPLHDLYLIKWLSVAFDYVLALVMMRAARRCCGR